VRLHPEPPVTLADIVDRTSLDVVGNLAEAGCIAASEEADELIRAAGGDRDVLDDLVSRRCMGEPLAWLTGAITFCGLGLEVTPGVYVPRPQSEPLARRAASFLAPGGVAVDLCTGAGAIAAVLSAAVPSARVVATDLDVDAVRCARRNGVEAFEGLLDDPLPRELERTVDVMTAVAPYVPTDSIRLLPRDVQAFEPRLALDGGAEGTDLLVEVVRRSTRWLRPGGRLCLELGGDQADPIGRSLLDVGFGELDVMVDDEGDTRAVCARLGEVVAATGAEASVPEFDLRKAGGPEDLVQLAAVVYVVREDPLQDPTAIVDPLLGAPSAMDHLVEHVERPSIQAALYDAER
jgi:release factor glutamine methyltransferase